MKGAAALFVILAILFTYLPAIPSEGCPEKEHSRQTNLDCGYLFHCPALPGTDNLEASPLPVAGRLVSIPSPMEFEELPFFIFHPPKVAGTKSSPLG